MPLDSKLLPSFFNYLKREVVQVRRGLFWLTLPLSRSSMGDPLGIGLALGKGPDWLAADLAPVRAAARCACAAATPLERHAAYVCTQATV